MQNVLEIIVGAFLAIPRLIQHRGSYNIGVQWPKRSPSLSISSWILSGSFW